MTRVAVITIAHGRHDHLRMQREGLLAGSEAPGDHVIVAMDDPELEEWVAVDAATCVAPLARHPLGLPLAAARNLGAGLALERGAEVLVFLDVDCVPSPELMTAYREAAESHPRALLCGPVAYLPPPPAEGYALDRLAGMAPPHPARPAPPSGVIDRGGDYNLFWSLSFSLTEETWRRLGGFHEDYVGYGGEDTDFARVARSRGVELAWVGSAMAHHQFHEVESPPVRHLDDILRNGEIFAGRWGEWPMAGWFDAFEERGLVVRRDDGSWRRPQ